MEDSYRTKGMRKALARKLKEKGISDERVLAAIKNVPRHYFFDNAFLEHAYDDKAFPIGEGQTISQPYTVAYQTQLLGVEPNHKVLEIGTGSGYQCCVLKEIGAKTFTIEYNRKLFEKVRHFLPLIGYDATFVHGDGTKGLASHAPYDRILVTAGAPNVPRPLIDQLKIGGVLVIPVGGEKQQKMVRIRKGEENSLEKEEFLYFSFVPLLGEHGWDG